MKDLHKYVSKEIGSSGKVIYKYQLPIDRKHGEDNIIHPDNIFSNKLKQKTRDNLDTFFKKRFNVKHNYQVPLDKRKSLWEDKWRYEYGIEPEIREVKVSDIVPTQDYINSKALDKYLSNDSKDEILGLSVPNSSKVIIFDGHHKTASEIIKGKESVKIKVIKSYGLFKHYQDEIKKAEMNIFKLIRSLFGFNTEVSQAPIDQLDTILLQKYDVEQKIEKANDEFSQIDTELSLKIAACDKLIEKGVKEGSDNKKFLVNRLDRITDSHLELIKGLIDEKKSIEQKQVELESGIITKAIEITSQLDEEDQTLVKVELAQWKGNGLIKGEQVINQAKAITLVLEEFVKGGEGSKGGKVIGHTKSGKPIYEKHSATYLGKNAIITKVNKEMSGATSYNVEYSDKDGKNKTKASNIHENDDALKIHHEDGEYKSNSDKREEIKKGGPGSGQHGHITDGRKPVATLPPDKPFVKIEGLDKLSDKELKLKAHETYMASDHKASRQYNDEINRREKERRDRSEQERKAKHEAISKQFASGEEIKKGGAGSGRKGHHSLHDKLKKFTSQFSDKPKSWKEATGELADIHATLADEYNSDKEDKDKYKKHEGYSKTPEESNKRHKEGIKHLLDKLNDRQKSDVENHYKEWFDKAEDLIELQKSHEPTAIEIAGKGDVEYENKEIEGHYSNIIVRRAFKEGDKSVAKILFLKRAADKKIAPNQFCLPGGHIDEGETIEQAGIRELKEEANLECEYAYPIGKAKCDDGKWAYYLESVNVQGDPMLLDGESINAAWMSQEEWIEADLIFDLKDHLVALESRTIRMIPDILKKGEEDEIEKGGVGSGRHKVGGEYYFKHNHPNKTLRSRGAYLEKIEGDIAHMNMHDNDNDEKKFLPVPLKHLDSDAIEIKKSEDANDLEKAFDINNPFYYNDEEELIKGRAAADGEERTWGGKKYKKSGGKWIAVGSRKKSRGDEKHGPAGDLSKHSDDELHQALMVRLKNGMDSDHPESKHILKEINSRAEKREKGGEEKKEKKLSTKQLKEHVENTSTDQLKKVAEKQDHPHNDAAKRELERRGSDKKEVKVKK